MIPAIGKQCIMQEAEQKYNKSQMEAPLARGVLIYNTPWQISNASVFVRTYFSNPLYHGEIDDKCFQREHDSSTNCSCLSNEVYIFCAKIWRARAGEIRGGATNALPPLRVLSNIAIT